MVRYIRDTTGRFPERPYYEQEDLDQECESIIVSFLRSIHHEVRFPIETEDLKKLIERDADDLDCYADLSEYGMDVTPIGKPPPLAVRLAEALPFRRAQGIEERRTLNVWSDIQVMLGGNGGFATP